MGKKRIGANGAEAITEPLERGGVWRRPFKVEI
jgi:hypothetical protein